MLNVLLRKIMNRIDLSEKEAQYAIHAICEQQNNEVQAAAMLAALHTKGETQDELYAFISYLRRQIDLSHTISGMNVLDICGTGGDYKNTFNISTAAALLLASAGVYVAKHGGGAVSSKCGSMNVLHELGITSPPKNKIREILLNQNFVFLNAAEFNSALANAKSIRKLLGTRTCFNIIGPLVNPLRVTHQVVGVYSKHLLRPVAELLLKLGVAQAMVVHSQDGLDELSITAANYVVHVKNKKITEFILHPHDCGLQLSSLDTILGGSSERNAGIIKNIFAGEKSPVADMVLLNAAAGLIVYEKVNDFSQGIALLKQVIESGQAKLFLETIGGLT